MDMNLDLPESLRNDVESKWEAFQAACAAAGKPAPDSPDILSELYPVWVYSAFVAKTCIQDPALLIDLFDSGDLHRSYPHGRYINDVSGAIKGAADESALRRKLRQIRLREMVRIAWRDLI